MDGSSTQHAGGVDVVLQSPKGDCLEYAVGLQFLATNKEAEYEALIKGLDLAMALWAESLVVQGDSQLIIGQVMEHTKLRKNGWKDIWAKSGIASRVSQWQSFTKS